MIKRCAHGTALIEQITFGVYTRVIVLPRRIIDRSIKYNIITVQKKKKNEFSTEIAGVLRTSHV